MASNALPDSQGKLWSLAADMSDGLKKHGDTIGIVQNTQVKLDADLKLAKDNQRAFGNAGDNESDATTTRNTASSNAKAAIALTKRMLGDVPAAMRTIWPPGTTEIPDTVPLRIALLEKAADYLKDNKEQEVAAKNFTEEQLRSAFGALQSARSALNQAVSERISARTERDTAEKALRSRMSGLIEELARLLPHDDDRWYAFGLVPPDGIERPGIAPDNVHLRLIPPTTATADWSSTPRAHRYRAFYMVTGRDANFITLDPTTETTALIENLPAAGTLKFYLQATNPAGDSPKSDVVEVILG